MARKVTATTAANLGYEAQLWQMAAPLRNNMDAAEYKHVVLGLIFLKYISDAFEAKHAELDAQKAQGAYPEAPDEYRAASIFWVPKEARWSHLKANAPQPAIGTLVDDAMAAIERDNPSLKGVLPTDYARPGLDKQRLGQIINLVSGIELGGEAARSRDTLGTLDDKIELNRRMNETLEAMARALFKPWFVDFDPVRAKAWPEAEAGAGAEGDPGLPQALADLFPDSFEDSELGEIPRGWEVKSIGDLANVVGGTTPSTKNSAYWDGGEHAWATPKDLSALSVPVLLDTERRITDAGLAKIGSGLLPKGTVLLSSRAPIRYLAVAEIPVAINQGFIAMTPKPGMSNLFLLLWASVAHEEIVSRANGSTFLEISKAKLPPDPRSRVFGSDRHF